MNPCLWNASSYENELWVDPSLKAILSLIHELNSLCFMDKMNLCFMDLRVEARKLSTSRPEDVHTSKPKWWLYLHVNFLQWDFEIKSPGQSPTLLWTSSISALQLLSTFSELAFTQWHRSGAVLIWCVDRCTIWERTIEIFPL